MGRSTAAAAQAVASGLLSERSPELGTFQLTAVTATVSVPAGPAAESPSAMPPIHSAETFLQLVAAEMAAVAQALSTRNPTRQLWANCWWTMAVPRALIRLSPRFICLPHPRLTSLSAVERPYIRKPLFRCSATSLLMLEARLELWQVSRSSCSEF